MVIDFICDYFYEPDCNVEKEMWDYVIEESRWWAERPNKDKNFLRAVKRVYDCVSQEVINLWEFKMSMLDYMEAGGYGGSPIYNRFNNLPLKKIGKIIGDVVPTIER